MRAMKMTWKAQKHNLLNPSSVRVHMQAPLYLLPAIRTHIRNMTQYYQDKVKWYSSPSAYEGREKCSSSPQMVKSFDAQNNKLHYLANEIVSAR
jgi:hypothetical protein